MAGLDTFPEETSDMMAERFGETQIHREFVVKNLGITGRNDSMRGELVEESGTKWSEWG